MVDKLSTLDSGYQTGDLSVYPEAIDSKITLYDVKNNAETVLTHSFGYNSNFILVQDTSSFPSQGLIRIRSELIYYADKATGVFKNLKRGFAGSRQDRHPVGAKVSHGVMATPHNACKDAIYNIQHFLGLKTGPDITSFNGKLTQLEQKFLAPTPTFRAFPLTGSSPLSVRFQNFSNKEAVRFLWDFGDGGVSTDTSPEHTYLTEGNFTVQLRMVTSLGGSGIVTKRDYIKIRNDIGEGFIYVTPEAGSTMTEITFVDQTDGDIIQRHWNFGDGDQLTVDDPDVHTTTHTYTTAGSYDPTLLVVFADQTLKRVMLSDSIVITD